MSGPKAALLFGVFLVSLLAAGLVALYFISAAGFGFAMGIMSAAFLFVVVAFCVRIINGGGVRQVQRSEPVQDTPRALPAGTRPPVYVDSSGTWQVETPAALPAPRYDA